jgi:quinol monooxygenase YgiN
MIMSNQVGILARLNVQAGKSAEAIDALQAMLDHVASEDGTLIYILHRDNNDENVLWFYELYTDQAALGVHSNSDTMKALGPALGGLLAGRPEMTFLTPVGGKGL